jgi:hypothetical protein
VALDEEDKREPRKRKSPTSVGWFGENTGVSEIAQTVPVDFFSIHVKRAMIMQYIKIGQI